MTTPEGLNGSDGAGMTATPVNMVTAKQLQRAVADLQETKPGPGLVKVLLCWVLLALGTYAAMTAQSVGLFLLAGLASGLVLAVMIITTHDAIHHTLTGWTAFDEIGPRLISWPVLWMHGIYSEVHKIHHKMNGDDFNDPERVQWTAEEYERASALGKFYVRHQWFLDIFVLGGFALIINTLRAGLRYAKVSKSMRTAVVTDLVGIFVVNAVIYAVAYRQGATLRWFLFWLMMERCTGAVMQWRAHIEHYGLWGKGRHYFETQTYSCRNIVTNGFTSWFFNRLNFHSVHHAFPRVPFYQLETAHRRFLELYGSTGIEHLVEERGYLATSLRLATNPCVIGPADEQSASRRRRMIAVGG